MGKEVVDPGATNVAIRPLEWNKNTRYGDNAWIAGDAALFYRIILKANGRFTVFRQGGDKICTQNTMPAAQVAAQSDYERCIRSALVETATPANKALIDDLVGAVRLSKDEFQQLLSEVADPDIKAAIKFRIAHCTEVLSLAKTAEGGK